MSKKTYSIDDLLDLLKDPTKVTSLPNNATTWNRIGSNDSFEELGLDKNELQSFLEEWIADNPYANL